MTLIELQAKLEADLKIDPSKLLDETSSNLNLHAQYFSNLLRARIELKRQQIAMRELEKNRYNYYAGFAPDVYEYNLDARAIKFNLEGDKEILDMQKTITMLEIKLEFFAKACDLFKDRGFAIKNQIDLLKFQSGA
ncbi:recombination repair and ssDNA binding protein [Pseudomonas phage Astolliot]|nr:recombination repair and ssDNA binding protein [Pseudomonas phage Astolliot]